MKKILGIAQGGLVSKFIRLITSVKFIVWLACVLLLAVALTWFYIGSNNKDRVFWGMIDQNLKTSAYTRHTFQKSGAQSVDQVLQTATTPQQRVYSETMFRQTGVDSAEATTKNVGTPTQDYVQYTNIVTAQKGSDGQPLDFSKVLGVWGATEPVKNQKGQAETGGQIYGQAVLGFVPIGNLPANQRNEIVAAMKKNKVYDYKISATTRNWIGRPSHTLQVTVDLGSYVGVLKTFAGYTGLNNLDQEDPGLYAGQKVSFTVTVDGWTHQVISSTQSGGSRQETISGYNLRKQLPKAPTDTVPVDQLQNLLQSIQ